jgi:hypothetical protein
VTEGNFQVQDPTTAGRYLAGQLSDEEQAAYEATMVAHPEALRELEATARLKVGLAKLREQGQLDELLHAPGAASLLGLLRRPVVVALAASLTLALVGGLLWRNTLPRADILYASLGALQSHSAASRSLVGHYTLVRTRAANAEVLLPPAPANQALELRVLPDISPGAAGYLVTLFQVRADGTAAPRPLATSAAVRAGDDSFITLYVDSSLLTEGAYQLKVSAAGAPAGGALPESEYFQLRVAKPATIPGSASR